MLADTFGNCRGTYIVSVVCGRVKEQLKSVSSTSNGDFRLAVSTSNVVFTVKKVDSLEEPLDEPAENVWHSDERQSTIRNIDVSAFDGDRDDKFATCWTSFLGVGEGEEGCHDDGERSDVG